MIYMKKILACLIMAVMCFYACQNKQSKTETTATEIQQVVYDFDADSAYQFVAAQVAFGPRVPNTEAHENCAKYLKETLSQWVDTLYVQPLLVKAYDGKSLRGENIIGCINPESQTRILLAAHWDSRPFADHDPEIPNRRTAIDGANDGASGVGILLELARQLQLQKPAVGVDIIFFDIEDYGEPQDERYMYGQGENWCLGAQVWSSNPHQKYYRAKYGILLDMVGGANPHFAKEGTSRYFATTIQDMVWNKANSLGYGAFFTNNIASPITDDHLYVNQRRNIQMIDIIDLDPYTSTGFNPHWHTLSDNMENIDKNTLEMVGKVLMSVVMSEK